MGILGICNRTENWKTAQTFAPFFKNKSALAALAKRVGESVEVPQADLQIELFWRGVRDYLKKECKSISELYDLLSGARLERFGPLRQDTIDFPGLRVDEEWNYDVFHRYPISLSGKESDKLSNNLFYTEIDIAIQTPNCLLIGEAKGESTFDAKSKYVLVHQLIRQYVTATILVDLTSINKRVVPFVVGETSKLDSIRNNAQINFMHCQGWFNSETNVLSWEEIEELAKSARTAS